MKLAEEGELKLSDSLGEYLSFVTEDKKGITIHQLLTHTSGRPHTTGGSRYDDVSKEDYWDDFSRAELIYKPGTRHT